MKTKLILEKLEIPTPKYTILKNINNKTYSDENLKKILENLCYPLVVKPCSLGSSIGISFCKDEKEVKNAISFANLFDGEVIVEEAVQNAREVNIAVVGNRFKQEYSDIEEVLTGEKIFSFEEKYLNEGKTKKSNDLGRQIPARLPIETKEKILKYAKKFFEHLNLKGIVRIDFLIESKTNKVYFNEANTIPGSLANYLWETKKYSFLTLLDKIVDYATQEKTFMDNKIKTFSSPILSKFKNRDFLK